MTHLETIDAFVDHASGRLSEPDRALVDRHLTECASCRSAYALLAETLLPQPTPQRLTTDPFLPTRIRALAEQRRGARRLKPVLRWSFASVAFGAAIVLGILLGQDLSTVKRSSGSASSDLVSEFASSLSTPDLGDQWYSAIEAEGGSQR